MAPEAYQARVEAFVKEHVHILEIQPTRSGLYTVVCNEFCGLGHRLMVGRG